MEKQKGGILHSSARFVKKIFGLHDEQKNNQEPSLAKRQLLKIKKLGNSKNEKPSALDDDSWSIPIKRETAENMPKINFDEAKKEPLQPMNLGDLSSKQQKKKPKKTHQKKNLTEQVLNESQNKKTATVVGTVGLRSPQNKKLRSAAHAVNKQDKTEQTQPKKFAMQERERQGEKRHTGMSTFK